MKPTWEPLLKKFPDAVWKRWKNCWQLFADSEHKVGTVSCSKAWKNGPVFFAYVGGKLIMPDREFDVKYFAGEGAWSSLYRAKKVVEMEYCDLKA